MGCCPGPKTGRPFDPDYEGPSEADLARFAAETDQCPSCRAEIWHDVAICPSCRTVLDDAPRGRLSRTLIGVGLAGLIAFVIVVALA